ncbi:transposase family protein [Variovorax humicola]|uniref:transposase family protein n=1 Tax=Variovorax humicola TaxID=1769758 RepID=UPI003BF54A3F
MSVPDVRVDVHLSHPSGARFACPQCGMQLSVYDHAEERQWRHLDSCQFRTLLHARAPRVKCPEHGVLQTCRGPRQAVASRCCSRRWQSTCCRPARPRGRGRCGIPCRAIRHRGQPRVFAAPGG